MYIRFVKKYIDLLNLYPSLSKPMVSLSDLGVAHRVFFNWKEKGIIDYEHHFTKEDISNKVARKKIELNAFEALWLLIVKELRLFNVGLDTIGKLKSYLFSLPDLNIIRGMSPKEIKEIGNVGLSDEANAFLGSFDLNVHKLLDQVQDGPESDKIFYCPIGTLINAILMMGQSPSIFIFKKPLESELSFEIFNPELEAKYHEQFDEDYRTGLVQGLAEHCVINIPIRPLFEQFFEDRSLFRHAGKFDLFSPEELKILKILKSKDFDKIIIHKGNNNELTIESSSKEQVLGKKAVELRKILGLKEYERAEIIYRNNKNLVINNTRKQKLDLGKT